MTSLWRTTKSCSEVVLLLGRVANPRPVARIQSGSVVQPITDTADATGLGMQRAPGLGGRRMYFHYKATSGCVADCVVEPSDIENMDVGVGILFLAVLCAEIVLLQF